MRKKTKEPRNAERIQTSFLNPYEKKILVWLAERMPARVTSDMLTFVGFVGACIVAAGYALSNLNLNWLWLASFGFVVNWFGDSLDGSLARVRNTQRKTYGFFIDHNVDVINECIMFLGVGLSPLVNLTFMMGVLVGYLMLSVYVYIDCYLKGEHRLTYAGLGPTEFRLIAILVNCLFIFFPVLNTYKTHIVLFYNEFDFGIMDGIAVVVAAILFAIYLVSFIKDIGYFQRVDPPKPFDKE
jgi:phosphatidylglycerophosphate synthase